MAGTGQIGFGGDGGDALAATFDALSILPSITQDNVLIVDTENHVIRGHAPATRRYRVAGSGVRGSAGVGGPASQVQLDRPHCVFVDERGAIYIAGSSNNRVLKIDRN